jgi:bifunctional non-homologous end joining protein LigD
MDLQAYTEKRDFSKTPEPAAGGSGKSDKLVFVVQKHAASHLHYDFRLELDGVLKSWAIPKGPSTDPKVKHLAMMVEDHPFDYRTFEGNIPKGEYGGGTVIVWDEGTYEPIERIEGKNAQEKYLLKQLGTGQLKIKLHGRKLNGEFAMVKTHGMGENGWLMIKHQDEFASSQDITLLDRSVISGLDLEEMAVNERAQLPKSSTGKPDAQQLPIEAGKDIGGPDTQAVIAGMTESSVPGLIKPMKPTLVGTPFDDPDWVFEYKWDGYRAIAAVNHHGTKLQSRNAISFEKYFPIINVLNTWPHNVVIDGEIAVIDETGRTDFGALQNWKSEMDGNLVFYVFDILWLEGRNLMSLPLDQRQDILKEIMPKGEHAIIRRSIPYDTNGKLLFENAERKGYEGIVAKRKNSVYKPDEHSRDWLKIKVAHRQEVVIGGYSRNKDTAKAFSALLIGVFENERLRFVGKAGTGFSLLSQRTLMEAFEPFLTGECPFIADAAIHHSLASEGSREMISWLRPELVCEVNFVEVTKEGLFRQASFKGLRIDKSPSEVRLEIPQKISGPTITEDLSFVPLPYEQPVNLLPAGSDPVTITLDGRRQQLTHLDKILWPGEHITKRDMLNYYLHAAEFILPYLKERPMSLNRFPDGINGPHFYQKDITGKAPDWTLTYAHTTAKGENHHYLVGGDISGLLWMAGQGCIEINPWLSRIGSPACPDHCVIDLDPEETNTFAQVIVVAKAVKEVTDALRIPAFLKTSGSTGMHIYIPIGNSYSFDQSQQLAKLIVSLVNAELPKSTTLERKTTSRNGRIYLDFLQNRPEATIAGVYSLRPKPGATVSMPLHWDELKGGLKMRDFNIFNAIDRIRETGDLFKGVLGPAIDLPETILNAQRLLTAKRVDE